MRQNKLTIIILFSLLIGASGMYIFMNLYQNDAVETVKIIDDGDQEQLEINKEKLSKVETTYELILNEFVENISEEQLIEGAVQGMMSSLDDPYSVYMNKEATAQFNESLESSFEGIGAEMSLVDGKIIIVTPFKNSPAEKSGLKPRDQILKINDKSVEGFDLHDVTLKIRGKKGTKVKLEIKRDGLNEPLIVEVVRGEIPLETVHNEIFNIDNKKIGYLEITSFSEETADDFEAQLKKLEKQKIAGLVIDLRGNPGGLLSTVQDISKQIITNKKPFVQTETRLGEKNRFFTSLKKKKDYPIIALIDNGSASAAEILAGALLEVEGYYLVGETTFGKGTVQTPIEMGDGSSIKLTSLKWLTPDGNWIHKSGIAPTVQVEQPAIFKMLPLQNEATLERDMNSAEVRHAQEMLRSLGFEPGRVDGYFNNQTEVAVIAFQQAEKISATGSIDKQTTNKLNEVFLSELKSADNDLQLQTALKLIVK